ncbi:MAG: glycogen synthase, partial [Desulfuromonas sp.]|uniref:glycogen synthase n=1 Tax=Desulfuromonas sp. TaxID=892 RepID=UPI000CC4D244
ADAALAAPFGPENLRGKRACKRALQRELGLEPDPTVPIVTMVTRLDTQKGLDTVEEAWRDLVKRKLQFVLLGTGEEAHMKRFARIEGSRPGQVSINLSFDEALARRIYAGSDLFLMPSRYEPCGLGQLIALRYGTVPVVRRTGGLADTITDPRESPRRANGFSFEEPSAAALMEALDRALDLYERRRPWLTLVRRGMSRDSSWARSAERYVELYRRAMEMRDV